MAENVSAIENQVDPALEANSEPGTLANSLDVLKAEKAADDAAKAARAAGQQSDGSQLPGVENNPVPDGGNGTPETIELKINGEVKNVKIDELPDMIMMHNDFTQKTQLLAEQTKKYEAVDPFLRRLETEPDYYEHILNSSLDYDKQVSDDPTISGIPNSLLKDVQANKDMLAQIQLNGEIQALASEHGDLFNADEVMDFARKSQIGNLELAFLKLKHPELQAKAAADAVAEMTANGVVKSNASVSPGKPGLKEQPKVDLTKLNPTQKRTRATNMLKFLSGKS